MIQQRSFELARLGGHGCEVNSAETHSRKQSILDRKQKSRNRRKVEKGGGRRTQRISLYSHRRFQRIQVTLETITSHFPSNVKASQKFGSKSECRWSGHDEFLVLSLINSRSFAPLSLSTESLLPAITSLYPISQT